MKREEKIWDYIDGNLKTEGKADFETRVASDEALNIEVKRAKFLDSILKQNYNPKIAASVVSRIQKNIGQEFAIINESVWSKNDTIFSSLFIATALLVFSFLYGAQTLQTIRATDLQLNTTTLMASMILLAGSILVLSDRIYTSKIISKK